MLLGVPFKGNPAAPFASLMFVSTRCTRTKKRLLINQENGYGTAESTESTAAGQQARPAQPDAE
jgi:hypothetical protein